MELLESQDPEKKRLMDEVSQLKKNIEEDVELVSAQAGKILTNVLLIGGALALTYLLVGGLTQSKPKKKKLKTVRLVEQQTDSVGQEPEDEEAPTVLAEIGARVASEATVFLLNLAKEKLDEYLESKRKSNENS